MTKRHDLSFVYNDVIQCELGTMSDLSVKIKMIAQVLEENPLDTKAEIDATDANRVYYRPQYNKNYGNLRFFPICLLNYGVKKYMIL